MGAADSIRRKLLKACEMPRGSWSFTAQTWQCSLHTGFPGTPGPAVGLRSQAPWKPCPMARSVLQSGGLLSHLPRSMGAWVGRGSVPGPWAALGRGMRTLLVQSLTGFVPSLPPSPFRPAPAWCAAAALLLTTPLGVSGDGSAGGRKGRTGVRDRRAPKGERAPGVCAGGPQTGLQDPLR